MAEAASASDSSEYLALWEQELIRIMNDKQTDLKAEDAELKKANKQLQKENKRQEKALSEWAILISLKKKKVPNYCSRKTGTIRTRSAPRGDSWIPRRG